MEKLISITDFVLKKNKFGLFKHSDDKIRNYAKFLNQPLKIGMFVPCDDKQEVFFKGFEFKRETENSVFLLKDGYISVCFNKKGTDTIETLIGRSYELTDSAIKQIYG